MASLSEFLYEFFRSARTYLRRLRRPLRGACAAQHPHVGGLRITARNGEPRARRKRQHAVVFQKHHPLGGDILRDAPALRLRTA